MFGPPWITEHPEYWIEEVLCSCGNAAVEEKEDVPICECCIEDWYTCPICKEVFDYKGETKNAPCDNCKEED